MTQDITQTSSRATIETYVRSFLYTDTDGSTRLHQEAFQTWLNEQFSYLVTNSTARVMATAQATKIPTELQRAVGRERWQGDIRYPVSGNGALLARLVTIRDSLKAECAALEAPYRLFQAGLDARAKGLFAQMVAPTFPPGADPLISTRFYIETFATDWGEESAPSPVSSMVTMDQNDTATVTGSAPPAGRHVATRRLYRSATGAAGAVYRLQGEYPVAQTVMTDSKQDTELNDVCPSFGWDEPPAGLAGLVGLANGVGAGFEGRTLYFWESYKPYAWPLKYTKPLAHNIVGLAAIGQSLFVGTSGHPYVVSGSDAASMSEELVPTPVPCVAAASMVAVGGSVFYASPEGLALYENGRVEVVTSDAIDRTAWQAYNPQSMRAAAFDGRYVAAFTRADATRGMLVFDYKTRTICEMDQGCDALFANQDGLYALDGTAVLDLFPGGGAPLGASWHSKTYRMSQPTGFGWLQVDGAGAAIMRIYADGVLHHGVTAAPGLPVRLPPGRALDWRVEIDAAGRIDGVTLASTTEELKAAP